MLRIGPIEKAIYSSRTKHPLVIPQLDPSSSKTLDIEKVLSSIKEIGLDFLAIGGTIVDTLELQQMLDIATRDFGFKCLIYPTNASVFVTKASAGKTAIYWMNVLNAQSEYFAREMLVMNSLGAVKTGHELIPTTYVFDDRGSVEAAQWLAKANAIPRHKAYLSLSLALAAQYSGSRFYIMAGGSGCKLTPPEEHLKLLRNKTNLFLMPTSGIRNASDAKKMFEAGGDAIHVGTALEQTNGLKVISEMAKVATAFPGRDFLDD